MEVVKIIGAVLAVMLRALETARHVRGSIATVKLRWRKLRPARAYSPAKYRLYTMNPTIREQLPYGADPRAWPLAYSRSAAASPVVDARPQ